MRAVLFEKALGERAGVQLDAQLGMVEEKVLHSGAVATYLITWVCYGTWLPGELGAVPRNQNQFGAPLPKEDSDRLRQAARRMGQEPYRLDKARREVVMDWKYAVFVDAGEGESRGSLCSAGTEDPFDGV